MAIIVETGAIVPGANSYVSLADARAYASARGAALPVDDAAAEVVLLKAMDYLESFDGRFKGYRVTRNQPLSWPRNDVEIEGWPWTHTEIPRQLLSAQLALVVEVGAGEDPLNPSAAALPVVRERVEGAVEVEYANPVAPSKVSKTAPSTTLINLLLKHSGLSLIRA